MEHIILYGPPAVGKLTVAKELAKLNGYKILHNHLTNDLISNIFLRNSDEFREVNRSIRIKILKKAYEKDISIISTLCVVKNQTEEYILDVKKAVPNTRLVKLIAPVEILKKRVIMESRKEFGKPVTVEKLMEILAKGDHLTAEIDGSKVIDNSELSAARAAEIIHKSA